MRGCGIGHERRRPGGRVDLLERLRQTMGTPCNSRAPLVGGELARARDRRLDDECGEGCQDGGGQKDEHVAAAPVLIHPTNPPEDEPPPRNRGEHHDGGGDRGRDRACEDVAVLHVRQLMTDHAFELRVAEESQDPVGRGHRGVFRTASRREGVGGVGRDHVNLGHRQACPLGEPLDQTVQPVLRPHRLGLIHRQYDSIREPVRPEVHQGGEDERDYQTLLTAECAADEQQHTAKQPQERGGLEGVVAQRIPSPHKTIPREQQTPRRDGSRGPTRS